MFQINLGRGYFRVFSSKVPPLEFFVPHTQETLKNNPWALKIFGKNRLKTPKNGFFHVKISIFQSRFSKVGAQVGEGGTLKKVHK